MLEKYYKYNWKFVPILGKVIYYQSVPLSSSV